jgi:hypothetical protein
MNNIFDIVNEIYQILFVMSIINILFVIMNAGIKFYSKLAEDKDTKYILTNYEKICLWISVSIFFSYIIK